ncbi:MAG: helix-turn-helix domain-containing protein, partial [Nanoarchaeota archaeon]
MSKKIPEEKKEEIIRLYDKGNGMSLKEIAQQIGVSYPSVYGLTKLKKRINPETKKQFESLYELQDYQARQRINPETKKQFESRSEYDDYQARQRINPETKK